MKTILSLLAFSLIGSFAFAQVQAPVPEPEEKKETFVVVEEMPRFPGCENFDGSHMEKKKCADEKLMKFISSHIQYPEDAKKAGIEGRCFLSFVVEKDGTIGDINLRRDIGGGCGTEAVRVINLMNEKGMVWTPGKQRGKNVRVQYTVPVAFRL